MYESTCVQAFIVFANLVNRPCLSAFYMMDTVVMEHYYVVSNTDWRFYWICQNMSCFQAFSSLLYLHLPKLAKHFSRLGLRYLFINSFVSTPSII